MRSANKPALALTGMAVAFTCLAADGQTVSLAPADLVRATVQNELKAGNDTDNFMFRDRKETAKGSQTKLLVQTRDATAGIVIAINDQPLTPEQRKAEEARLQRVVNNAQELRRKQKQEKEDADRVTRIMKAMPDAFLYEYAGKEAGTPEVGKPGHELMRLSFRPNPDYDPPSRVEQVLTGMKGYMLLDQNAQRIARIDGTLYKDVSFGWGILGHLDKGGHFQVDQADRDGSWQVTRMSLSFTGKVLLFKGITIKSNEVFTDFRRVPTDLTFAQGIELLKKEEIAGNGKPNGE